MVKSTQFVGSICNFSLFLDLGLHLPLWHQYRDDCIHTNVASIGHVAGLVEAGAAHWFSGGVLETPKGMAFFGCVEEG